jgi:hypothetical protein
VPKTKFRKIKIINDPLTPAGSVGNQAHRKRNGLLALVLATPQQFAVREYNGHRLTVGGGRDHTP